MSLLTINMLSLISILLIIGRASAQVDAGGGTFSCYPCGRALCGFASGGSNNVVIDPSNQFGDPPRAPDSDFEPLTCREIQTLADRRELVPDRCSWYQQITASTSDPCNCQQRTAIQSETSTGQSCVNPNQPQPCQLCGSGKVIGDPERVISEGLYRDTCISFYDLQEEILAEGQGGFSNTLCNDLQGDFGRNCQCVRPGTPVTQCLAQLDLDAKCDPDNSAPNNGCCIGSCQFLSQYNAHLCTTQSGDPAPPTRVPNPPTPSPVTSTEEPLGNLAPPKFPTPTSAGRIPGAPPTVKFSCRSDDDCRGDDRCRSLGYYGSLCVPRNNIRNTDRVTGTRGGAGGAGVQQGTTSLRVRK